MKHRILLYVLIGSLAAAVIFWISLSFPAGGEGPFFEANVNQECAPWDGMAYWISIPYDEDSIIEVSIWKSPDFKSPVTYSFPDSSGRVGHVSHQPAFGPAQLVSGKITLQPFEVGNPITGNFNFTSEAGEKFIGSFKAEWGDQIALCG